MKALDDLQEHHQLALKLLVGRSLSAGLPWDLEADRAMIERERELWGRLTLEEREMEQVFLQGAWREGLTVVVDPAWGPWTEELCAVKILDHAFGLPRQSYRPWPKGPGVEVPGDLQNTVQWLWTKGFQVIDVGADRVSLIIPTHRYIQEGDRLLALLLAAQINVVPLGQQDRPEGAVMLQSSYDPVTRVTVLEVLGLRDPFLAAQLPPQ